MDEQQFRCRNCKRLRARRVEGQQYCSHAGCQRARKNAWRRKKYACDVDYRLTQAESTKAWLASQGGSARYFQRYRDRQRAAEDHRKGTHPMHQETKRSPSIEVAQDGTSADANSDAIRAEIPIKTGRYLMFAEGDANSDAILVELKAISGG